MQAKDRLPPAPITAAESPETGVSSGRYRSGGDGCRIRVDARRAVFLRDRLWLRDRSLGATEVRFPLLSAFDSPRYASLVNGARLLLYSPWRGGVKRDNRSFMAAASTLRHEKAANMSDTATLVTGMRQGRVALADMEALQRKATTSGLG